MSVWAQKVSKTITFIFFVIYYNYSYTVSITHDILPSPQVSDTHYIILTTHTKVLTDSLKILGEVSAGFSTELLGCDCFELDTSGDF